MVLTDCIGPSNPTYAVDYVTTKCKALFWQRKEDGPQKGAKEGPEAKRRRSEQEQEQVDIDA